MLTLILFLTGLALLVLGAELLVRGAASLAVVAGISPLVVGLTVVALGTSAPEMAVTVAAALGESGGIALGNVVGSNICNVLLILGLAALVTPLAVQAQLVRFDVPLLVGLSGLVLLLGLDGVIGRLDGLLLLGAGGAYLAFLARQSRRERLALACVEDREAPRRGAVLLCLAMVVVGLGLLVGGSHLLVHSAKTLARWLGVSDLVIGLTVVAFGTSLPEAATSVVAGLRGERDLAVGNVVGSCLFNLFFVLGLGGALAPGGIPVTPGAIGFDLPVMVATALACLPIFFTDFAVSRAEGALLLGYYAAYLALLILGVTGSPLRGELGWAVLTVAVPVTTLGLGVASLRQLRRQRRAGG